MSKTEIRDGMKIDWDVPIEMDDGIVLRCDVYRPIEEDKFPVILSYGPYGKYLAFQDGYVSCWERMAEEHPDVTAGSTNKYQSWEVVDPEKWVPHGYAIAGVCGGLVAQGSQGPLSLRRMGGKAVMVQR
jgi:predicted acyl esterase